MSIQAIATAMKVTGVSSSEKLLLICIANYADENGRCWPSNKRLAADSSLTDRTVRNTLKTLSAAGLISRKERERADGSRGTDIITLHFDKTEISGGGEIISKGGEMVSGGGEAASPLTTFEPSKNHQEPSDAVAAKAIWEAQNPASRKASSAEVLPPLRAAIKRGHSAALIVAACQAYYAHPSQQKDAGRWAKSPVNLLEDDKWRDYAPPPPKPVPADVLARRAQHYRDTGEWRPAWGPMPTEIAA